MYQFEIHMLFSEKILCHWSQISPCLSAHNGETIVQNLGTHFVYVLEVVFMYPLPSQG